VQNAATRNTVAPRHHACRVAVIVEPHRLVVAGSTVVMKCTDFVKTAAPSAIGDVELAAPPAIPSHLEPLRSCAQIPTWFS